MLVTYTPFLILPLMSQNHVADAGPRLEQGLKIAFALE